MKIVKIGVWIILLGIIGIQFVPVNRTNSEVISDFDGPDEVKAIFQRACYDCHSEETKWPWYSYVAPISWRVAHDVEEGREHLNFSDWAGSGNLKYMAEEIYEEMEDGEMPLKQYLWTHPEAKISGEELALIKQWVETF